VADNTTVNLNAKNAREQSRLANDPTLADDAETAQGQTTLDQSAKLCREPSDRAECSFSSPRLPPNTLHEALRNAVGCLDIAQVVCQCLRVLRYI
jgi:hypothetical protein